VIASFASKELRGLFETGRSAKIDQRFHKRILARLDALNAAIAPADMNIPGFDFHPLGGARAGVHSVHVNGPWCVTFGWDDARAVDVDFEQYH